MQTIVDQTVQKIKLSKIYKVLDDQTIENAVDNTFSRFGAKDLEKKSKNLLHQIWGAYYSNRPDFNKFYQKTLENLENIQDFKEILDNVLKIHSSTKERLSFYKEFYEKIFAITGRPDSIIDHACGLNPLSFYYMSLPKETSYKAFDIDKEEIDFINNLFKLFKVENHEAFVKNIFQYDGEYADIIFMLKFLPVIDMQSKNSLLDILNKQNCKYLVISFPSKSIAGRQKGMENFYTINFENLIKDKFNFERLTFSNEIVYIIKKLN